MFRSGCSITPWLIIPSPLYYPQHLHASAAFLIAPVNTFIAARTSALRPTGCSARSRRKTLPGNPSLPVDLHPLFRNFEHCRTGIVGRPVAYEETPLDSGFTKRVVVLFSTDSIW